MIFPEKNAGEFAKCLRRMITDKDLRKKFGENGRKWAQSEVSLSAVAKRMAATVEEIAGSAAKKA